MDAGKGVKKRGSQTTKGAKVSLHCLKQHDFIFTVLPSDFLQKNASGRPRASFSIFLIAQRKSLFPSHPLVPEAGGLDGLMQKVREMKGKIKERQRTRYTGLGNNSCMWLRECCRQVEAEVASNSRNKILQNWEWLSWRPLYRSVP